METRQEIPMPPPIALKRLTGMRAFTLIWIGQVLSAVGSGMTGFALGLWAWQLTGRVTDLGLITVFSFAPSVLLSPIAGVLVDRWDRKLVTILTDLGAGLSTVAVLLLYAGGQLQIWHVYVASLVAGAFQSFQFPAYSAVISTMLPREHYGRANGMMSIVQFGPQVISPLLAGGLMSLIGVVGIMLIDVITFVFAIGMLLIAHIPQSAETSEGRAARGSLWQESIYGFRYILKRPSLLALQLNLMAINLLVGIYFVIIRPLILARTDSDAGILGMVLSAGGVGGFAGGVLMSIWGGPKRRIHGLLGGMALGCLPAGILLGMGQSAFVWAAGAFFAIFFFPIVMGSNQAIWQAKVEPDVQGRVFAVRRLIAQLTMPIGMFIAGPLSDSVFEPAMQPGGTLTAAFERLVGTGAGAGMATMLLIVGLLGALIGLAGYLVPVLRDAETLLPDHEAAGAP